MNFLKKAAVLLLAAVLMICSTVTIFADTSSVTLHDIVISTGNSFEINTGTSTMIPVGFTVRCGSEEQTQEVAYTKVSLSGGDKYVTAEELEKTVDSYTGNVGFLVKVQATATAGDYTFTASVTAYDTYGCALASKSYPIKIKVKSRLKVKELTIESYKVSSDAVKPGDKFDIEVTLKNKTGIDVKGAELQLDGLDTNKFVLDSGFSKQYVDIKNEATGTAKFTLIAQKGMTLERETLNLKLSYNLDDTKSDLKRETSTQIIINCVPDSSKITYDPYDLTMTGFTVSSDKIEKGTKFELTVMLKNNGKYNIPNARLTINADSTKFYVESGLSYKDLSIPVGGTAKVTFKLIGGAGISSAREYIPMTLSFGNVNSSLQAVVSCKYEDKDIGKYALIMTNYKVSTTGVEKGTKFDLAVDVKNNSKKNIENARVSIAVDGTKFSVESGLAFHDFSIKAGETKRITFKMIGGTGIASEREYIPINIEFGSNTSTMQAVVSCKVKDSDKDIGKYDLIMTDYTVSRDDVEKGTKFSLTIFVKNHGEKNVDNARVSITPDSAKFLIDTGLSYKDLSLKQGETKEITFKLIGAAGIAAEREAIPVVIDFGSNSTTLQTYVSCLVDPTKGKKRQDLEVTRYSINVPEVAEKTVFDLTFDIKNNGEKNYKEVRVTLNNLDGTKFAVDSGFTYRDFDIASGETKTFTFTLIGCRGIASVREVIPIQIDYPDASVSDSATIKCSPKEDEKDKKAFSPTIIIESYNYGGDYVDAGKQFPLNIIIKNASSEANIRNLKVTINGVATKQDGAVAYSPANSANSFFFESLPTHDTASINMSILARADATPNSYPLELSFSYEYMIKDERYQANPFTETISVPLRQQDRLEIGDPELPTNQVMVGDPATISTSLVNKGKSDVFNVSAEVSGTNFTADSQKYYIGNIKSGSEEIYDVKLTPMEEGEVSGNITITYEDSNGDSKKNVIPFSFQSTMPFFDNSFDYADMEMPPEQEGGLPILPIILIAAGVIVVIIIIVVVVKKSKKRKAELEDNDEDI